MQRTRAIVITSDMIATIISLTEQGDLMALLNRVSRCCYQRAEKLKVYDKKRAFWDSMAILFETAAEMACEQFDKA